MVDTPGHADFGGEVRAAHILFYDLDLNGGLSNSDPPPPKKKKEREGQPAILVQCTTLLLSICSAG